MAAKKIDETSRKAAAKKAIPKRTPEEPGPFRPEILADLAVKLVQLRNTVLTNHPPQNPPLADLDSDAIFADALKRAETLLLAASGKSDQDVHAYQLFTVKDGLMSFKEIAERFSDFGWDGLTSPNTITRVIEELVIAAESKVQNERERYDRRISLIRKYPGGLYYVADRVRRHIRNMIWRTDLRDLFDDPIHVADEMGQNFFRLMGKNIPGDWERHLDEEKLAAVGFETFIPYVCGGLTYEQFIGDPPHPWLDLERLGCLVFFLESLSLDAFVRRQSTETNLTALMRLLRGRNDVPPLAVSQLNECLAELKKSAPDTARVSELASGPCMQLRGMWERWYLSDLARAHGFFKLRKEIGAEWRKLDRGFKMSVAEVNSTKKPQHSGVRKILKLLRQVDNAGKGKGSSLDAPHLRQLLDDVLRILKDPRLIAAADVPARFHAGTLSDEIKRVANSLEKGLGVRPPAKKHLRESLNLLLNKLEPRSGDRKCRPYELFLFAAQNHLQERKLVRKLRGFIPHPPCTSYLSILESHNGIDIKLGIQESG